MAFDAQITDLVGGTIDQTACDQWMEDGVRELTNLFPKNLKEMCYSKNTFTSAAAGSEAETIASQHLGNVFAGSYVCRKINGTDKYKASDSDEILYATATDPAYYVEGSILNILPASSSGVYYLIPDPSIDVDADSAISSFPNEAEYLVVLYAAIKQLHQYMNSKKSDLPSDIAAPVLETISESLPTWSAPSDFVTPIKPVVPTLSAQSVSITGTAPTFVKPVIVQTAFSSYSSGLSETDPGVFSLNATAPAIPSLSTTSVTFSQDAPTFTKPSIAPDFAQVNTYIDTNEDIELASAKLQEISAQLSEYQANIQNEQIEFNKESTEYQAQLQISIQNAQFDNQEDARKLQKYQAETGTYQININKEVQQYSQKLSQYQLELNTSYQAWAKTESDNISIYGTNIQNELNEFNKENTVFRNQLDEEIQEAQNQQSKDSNEYNAKLQKYSNEITAYQAQVNTSVQEYTNNLQADMQEYQQLAADYQRGLQMIQGS